MMRNYGGDDADLARRVRDRLRQRLRDFAEESGHRYALGAPPDDEASARFAHAEPLCAVAAAAPSGDDRDGFPTRGNAARQPGPS